MPTKTVRSRLLIIFIHDLRVPSVYEHSIRGVTVLDRQVDGERGLVAVLDEGLDTRGVVDPSRCLHELREQGNFVSKQSIAHDCIKVRLHLCQRMRKEAKAQLSYCSSRALFPLLAETAW